MQFFSKYFVMKLLKSLLASVFASVILSACTLDAERPTDVQHIDKNDITWQQHLKKIKQIPTSPIPVEEPKDPDTCNVYQLLHLFLTPEEDVELRAKYQA